MLAELDGNRYHAVLTSLGALVEQPPLTEAAEAAAGKALPRLVARSHERVRGLVDRADAVPAGTELLHDARKAAKLARYAGESVAAVFGGRKSVTRWLR